MGRMRPLFPLPFPGACALVLLLANSALAQQEVVVGTGDMPSVQLIGWSADEQRYAFRAYSHSDTESLVLAGTEQEQQAAQAMMQALDQAAESDATPPDGLRGDCKGYVDHQGKPFTGKLELVVFERDQRLLVLPIQDQPVCTAPEVAAARLAEAKKKLAELGIDLSRPGQELVLVSGKRLPVTPQTPPPYALEYVNKVKKKEPISKKEEDSSTGRMSGTLELYLHRQGKKQKVYSRKVDKEYDLGQAGFAEARLVTAHVSPSGARAVVLGIDREGNMRANGTTLKVVTVLGWPEGSISKEK